jgi:hypothetical protein
VVTLVVRLKIASVLLLTLGRGKAFEERMAEAGKPAADSTAETLVEVV